jgi:hypothetical protein
MFSRFVDIRIQAKLSLDQTPHKAKAHKPHLSRVSNLPSFCPGPVKPPFAISIPITHLAAHTATYTHRTPFSQEPKSIVYTGESLSISSLPHAGQGYPGLPGKDGRGRRTSGRWVSFATFASHRVFGIVRSIDPRDLPLLPLRHLISSQKDSIEADCA